MKQSRTTTSPNAILTYLDAIQFQLMDIHTGGHDVHDDRALGTTCQRLWDKSSDQLSIAHTAALQLARSRREPTY